MVLCIRCIPNTRGVLNNQIPPGTIRPLRREVHGEWVVWIFGAFLLCKMVSFNVPSIFLAYTFRNLAIRLVIFSSPLFGETPMHFYSNIFSSSALFILSAFLNSLYPLLSDLYFVLYKVFSRSRSSLTAFHSSSIRASCVRLAEKRGLEPCIAVFVAHQHGWERH